MKQNCFVRCSSVLLFKIYIKSYIRVVGYENQHKFDAVKIKSYVVTYFTQYHHILNFLGLKKYS